MHSIDWAKKSPDDIYEFHRHIEGDKEALDFVILLLKKYPESEIPWMDMFYDSMFPLLEERRLDEVLAFVELFKGIFPEDYMNEYGFAEKELVSHYLYRNEIQNVAKRLEIVAQRPCSGLHEVTTSAMFQLIYHGYYILAYKYALKVRKPLFENEEMQGNLHFHFSTTIYLYELENIYRKILTGEQVDARSFKIEMDQYDIDESEGFYLSVFRDLSEEPSLPGIMLQLQNGQQEGLITLNILFCKFMYDQYRMPFMLSDRLWNILMNLELFGSEKSDGGFFYIPYKTLEEQFVGQHLGFLCENEIEIFGKVWGLQYPYYFLHEMGLINNDYYSMMKENIGELRFYYMQNIYTKLWQMNFVFNWPVIDVIDPFEQQLFNDTYHEPEEIVGEKINQYFESLPVNERIEAELKIPEKVNRNLDQLFYSEANPYIRLEPKTERNAPCPCGSGLKYKKCCLSQSE